MKPQQSNNNKHSYLSTIAKLKLYGMIALAIVFVVVVLLVMCSVRNGKVAFVVNDKINDTPMQLVSMSEIGQWEFLTIEDEELVDTVRKGFFRDAALTRIYYGTIRLGFDMRSVDKDWIVKQADTLHVTLPPIVLLDSAFIDEARTKPFYETGSWTDKDRADLYKRAQAKMLKRCLTKENIRSAEENASRQVSSMLNSMGYKNIQIRFRK